MKYASVLTAVALCISPVAAVAQSVTLTGPEGRTRSVSLSDLAAMPHETAVLPSEHGAAKHCEGVPLTVLLESVGAPTGKALHGPALADLVVVSAGDGYRVVLGLAETDPGVRPGKTLLADRCEGAPLPPNEGPLRLVVEGDLRPVRSVRMVTAIRVVAVPAAN